MGTDLITRSWNVAGFDLDTRSLLNDRWHEPHRHYHGMMHIWDLLHKIESIPANWCPPEWKPALFRIAWLHDADYWADTPNDERRSADLMKRWLAYEESHEEVRAVLDTAGHSTPSSPISALFLDLDLSRIGTPVYDQFILDSEMIRAEYRRVVDELWLHGRRDFLAGMADRPAIFHTPWGHYHCETNARRNIDTAVKYYDDRIAEL